MNQIEREFFHLVDMTHNVRDSILALIGEEDMAFNLPGNKTLGELVLEYGDVEHVYTLSFKTFKQDFGSKAPGREEVSSGPSAVSWLHGLDEEFKKTLSGLSDEDLAGRHVDRGGWEMPVMANFHTYREAVLILFGKTDIYLKALGKELPEEWRAWVG